MSKGSRTRSGLLWEVERLLKETYSLPQVLLMENVPAILGKANIKDFVLWRDFLEELGYKCYLSFLNAKHYGIPQNRNRCFMVSLFGDYYYDFPKRLPLKLKLKDMLEDSVDKKYYLSERLIKQYHTRSAKYCGSFAFRPKSPDDIACTITTKSGSRPMDNYIIESDTMQKRTLQKDTAYGYRVVFRKDFERLPMEELSRTLLTHEKNNAVILNGKIRKLTPLECFRLMGFSDEDYYICLKSGLSNAQAYKQTGNSIVVKVLEEIFKMMF